MFLNPFQLHEGQHFLILGLPRALLCEAWIASDNPSGKHQTQSWGVFFSAQGSFDQSESSWH